MYAGDLKAPAQIPGLLGNPMTVRVLGHRDLEYLSGRKLDEEQDVRAREADGVHGEEVAGHDRARLSAEKAAPGQSCSVRRGLQAGAPKQVADDGGGDAMAEPADLAGDPLVAPKRIVPGESQDKLTSAGNAGRPIRRARRPKAAHRRCTMARCQPRTVWGLTISSGQELRRRRVSSAASTSRSPGFRSGRAICR